MSLYNAILWLDPDQAFIFHFDNDESEEVVVHSKHEQHRFHHRKHATKEDADDCQRYFRAIETDLSEIIELVICGPDATKFKFDKHLAKHRPSLLGGVIGVENLHHADDESILNLAKRYFKTPKGMVHSSYVAGV